MRSQWLVMATLLATSAFPQAPDPFLGTWIYNAQKSPTPTITYAIRDLGDHRYALTGSSNQTTELKADGKPVKSPSGDTVSFTRVDDHTWHMDRTDTRQLARTYSVSSDDTTLTLTDRYTNPDKSHQEDITHYHRVSPGSSLYGHWRSYAIETRLDHPPVLTIERYGARGLSFITLLEKRRTDLTFDHKPSQEQGPDGPTGTTTFATRPGARLIRFTNQQRGQPSETDDFKVSGDGRTLTTISHIASSGTVYTSVWDRKEPAIQNPQPHPNR